MKKTGKIALAMVTALTIVSCGTDVARDTSSPLSGRMQYAPTALRDTSSHSLLTVHSSPLKEDFTALAKKYNFAELEKEYKSFKTKALADTYVKKMFNKFLIVTPNSVQVIRQVEFSRYLKNNGDTSYETSLKNIFSDTPVLYSSLTGMPAVQSKMTSESGTFGFYILGVSPNQTVPTALPATNITSTSFTANWSAVTGATSYTLIVDGVEIPGITGTNHTLNSLTAGSNHKYSVKAITSGVAGAASNEINVNTILTAPVASSATGITQTSLTANWSTVSGATSYTLVFNGTETTGITGTSHTVNTLTPGTGYSYYVKAVNANTESVNSSTITSVTIPATPTASAATVITTSGFTANWSPIEGVTNYLLTINGTETDVGNVISYSKTGLFSNTTYTYSVKAKNISGTSPASNTITLKTISTLTDGLVAYYPFNGNANDESGNNNHGTNNGAVLTADRFGNGNKAYNFNGIDNYIQIQDSNSLDIGYNNYTITAWIKTSFSGIPNGRIFSKGSFGSSTGYMMRTGINNSVLHIESSYDGSCKINGPGNIPINDGNWHFVAMLVNRNTGAISYVDNVTDSNIQVDTSAYDLSNTFNPRIGAWEGDYSAEPFNGAIDNVRVYNRALSPTEIQQLYNELD